MPPVSPNITLMSCRCPFGRVSKISNPLFHPASVFILLTAGLSVRLPFVRLSKSFIKTPSRQRLNSTRKAGLCRLSA
ncbi:hypothetical protein Barb4_02116 [Bacteroidales bacterium Barb4]|nr:hypothetical protein Barb4_02116 [Bacteroidales bacterium Barb4]